MNDVIINKLFENLVPLLLTLIIIFEVIRLFRNSVRASFRGFIDFFRKIKEKSNKKRMAKLEKQLINAKSRHDTLKAKMAEQLSNEKNRNDKHIAKGAKHLNRKKKRNDKHIVKLEEHIDNVKNKNNALKAKYINNTDSILKIKDEINGLLKTFTELNKIESRNEHFVNLVNKNNREIDELNKKPQNNFFDKTRIRMQKEGLLKKNKEFENMLQKNREAINNNKNSIEISIKDLLSYVTNIKNIKT